MFVYDCVSVWMGRKKLFSFLNFFADNSFVSSSAGFDPKFVALLPLVE